MVLANLSDQLSHEIFGSFVPFRVQIIGLPTRFWFVFQAQHEAGLAETPRS